MTPQQTFGISRAPHGAGLFRPSVDRFGRELPLRYCHTSPPRPLHSSVTVSFARSGTVSNYRAYIIGHDGHFLGAEILSECTDDETAEKAAQKLVGGHSVELWDRDRLVNRLFSKKK